MQWTPRILCILAILFVSMFALDSFDPRFTPWQQIQAFLIHLIPTYILILFLVVSWKWELIGGLMLIILALGFTPFIYTHNYQMNHSVLMSFSIVLMINFPFILTGGLFVLSHFLKKKNNVSVS
jgi:hypothetical protein